jgi:predicted DNA-binding WGR domain protein
MTISVVHETTLLMHEGGTKFYEVVQLHAPDIKQHLLIKRWGKTSALSKGGEIQIQMFGAARKAGQAADTVIRQKEGRGYAKRTYAVGLHGYGGTITNENIKPLLLDHYGRDNTAAILREFMTPLGEEKISGLEATSIWVDEADSIVSEEPAPEPERGDSWGSW